MSYATRSYLHISLLMAGLILLPGCEWLSKKSCASCTSHGGQPLVTFDGKTVATTGELEKQLSMLFKSRPGVQEMIEKMPVDQQRQIYKQIADSLVETKVLRKAVAELGLDAAAEFQENLQLAYEALETQMMLQAFQEFIFNKIKSDVTDEKVREYYESNCSKLPIFKQPPFLLNAAGIRGQLVEVASDREAQNLAAQARAKGFDAAVKEAKKSAKVVLINDRAYDVDEAVRTKAQDVKKLPATLVVAQKNGKHAVVHVAERQEDAYAPCEKVKDQVQQIMSQERFMQAYKEEVAKLKEKYGVVLKDDVLEVYVKHAATPAATEAAEESAPKAAAAA